MPFAVAVCCLISCIRISGFVPDNMNIIIHVSFTCDLGSVFLSYCFHPFAQPQDEALPIHVSKGMISPFPTLLENLLSHTIRILRILDTVLTTDLARHVKL
jgi:hypothetical protein